MNKTSNRFVSRPTLLLAAAVLALAGAAQNAAAQITDLAQTPVVTATPSPVKPNLMFILDDSGSMGWDFMPDQSNFATGKYGFYASQCNGLAYNPAITYLVPVNADGTNQATGTYTFPTPASLPQNEWVVSGSPTIATGTLTFEIDSMGDGDYRVGDLVTVYSRSNHARWMIGIVTAADSDNNTLSVNFTETSGTGSITDASAGRGDFRPFYFTYSGTHPALSYTYTSSGGNDTSTEFYRQCDSVVGVSPGNGLFTRVSVTSSNINDNYRNWYTYHRTRMLTMRTATSHAFKAIDSNYRVGFSTINSKVVDGSKFLDITDFDATQKSTWYSRLFGSDPDSGTPLRGALSKAGTYFAKKGKLGSGGAQSYDPVQYSCQKNFSILTTDGYWNDTNEGSTYGPLKLDSTAVGQQDGAAARPMRDGSTTVSETRTSLLQERNAQPQSATVSLQARTLPLYTRTGTADRRGRVSWGSWTSTTSCTFVTSGSARTDCGYGGSWSGWAPAAACAVAAEGTGSSGTWNTARECRYTTPTWANVSSCTASSPGPSSGPVYTVASATLCQTVTGTPTNVGSCTTSATKECLYTAWSSWTAVASGGSCTPTAQSTGPSYTVSTARECRSNSTGGSTDSLADVAMYYYETDLRTSARGNCTGSLGTNVCDDNVAQRGDDDAKHQHMTTFTLGLGVSGTLGFHPNYLGGLSSDYEAIKAGTKNWPNPGDGAGAVNIDDLWHSAVNGRGQYFSAGDPSVLATSLSNTLAAIKALNGTAAAAATSTLQPVPGENNTEFVTSYRTVEWTGDIEAFKVDPYTGARSTTTEWSAQERLDKRTAARKIYYRQPTAGANTGTLREFTFDNLNSDGLGANFTNACTKAPALSQCANTGYDKTAANDGTNLVTWLRGGTDTRYRTRQHVLSDIVGGAPVHISKPPFLYTENDYQTFVTSKSNRTAVVYVPSNGGMLHAFRASDGEELWAYVPTTVMNRMYILADSDYANRHEYFVNASPIVGDFWVPALNEWRTILVGGLGAGGRGYYALDITDPENPKALWEFGNDALGGSNNLGYTFGNPVITKRSDGKWVVMFTSGYNNVSPGNGNGILFVVDALTGQLLKQVSTRIGAADAGSPTAPSGLSRINNWVETPRDNTTLRVYGGDLLGNVWRFDIDGLVQPHSAALRLAQLTYGSPAVAQPITARPELAAVTSGGLDYPVVYVGTGKLLGVTDLTDASTQSLYAIKDPMSNTQLGNLRARTDMVEQTLTIGTDDQKSRSVTNNPVDWSTKTGWRVDFPSSGERVSIDMRMALSSLLVATNAPTSEVCAGGGGTSYLYEFDFTSGSSVPGANGVVGEWLGDAFAVGVGALQLYSDAEGKGKGNAITCIQMSNGSRICSDIEKGPTKPLDGRRTSWRELIN